QYRPLDLDGVEVEGQLVIHAPSFRLTAGSAQGSAPDLTQGNPKRAARRSSTLGPMMTGWEPNVPEDDSILRQWVLTNLTRYRTLVERVRGQIDVWDVAALFDTGSTAVFDNAAVLRRPPTAKELDELI